jgi:mono/diheme cytochrome c family protein
MKRSVVVVLVGVVAAGAMAWETVGWWRSRNLGPVQRGWRTAAAQGCFTCHGPGGRLGLEDPGNGIGGVPTFTKDDLAGYARNDQEIREWILDGMPRRLRAETTPEDLAEGALIRMPRFRGVLSDREVDDLVAYVKAVGDVDSPAEPRAAAGRQAAARLGCFACHGPQGRGSLPNPRSLKGYIPAWDGPDFPELARDDAEVVEWILDGRPRRLQEDGLARRFLDRQVVQMPAYRGRITPGELEEIVHYIKWLRVSK